MTKPNTKRSKSEWTLEACLSFGSSNGKILVITRTLKLSKKVQKEILTLLAKNNIDQSCYQDSKEHIICNKCGAAYVKT